MATDSSSSSSTNATKCVAPAEVEDKWNLGSDFICEVTAGSPVVIPHIDTCVGLIIKTKDGKTLCTHVSLVPRGEQEPNIAQAIRTARADVDQRYSGSEITSVQAIGPSYWAGHIEAFHSTATFLQTTDDAANGVDVTVSTGKVEVEKCTGVKK